MNGISNMRVSVKIDDMVEFLGQYAAVGYAQRVVGMKETGTLTESDCTQINSINPDNFLMNYSNLCRAHVNQKEGTEEQHKEWKQRAEAVPLEPMQMQGDPENAISFSE